MDDPWDDPDTKAWLADTQKRLPQMIRDSRMVVSIVPESDPDVKFCVELGMAIMLDKPLVFVVRPGTKVAEHLIRCADEIIECDMSNEADKLRLAEALKAWMEKTDVEDGDG